MGNFLYAFLLRIIPPIATYFGAAITTPPLWVPLFFRNHKNETALGFSVLLFLILEYFATRRPLKTLYKTQQRMGNALFDEWRKGAKIAPNPGEYVSPGIRINVMLLKRFFFFQWWTIEYRDKGRMENDPDRKIKFKLRQGAVGQAYKTQKCAHIHFEDLRLYNDQKSKHKYLKETLRMTPKQIAETDDVLVIITVLLKDKFGDIYCALNVDAYDPCGAVFLEFTEVQAQILKLAEFADVLYGEGSG